MGHDAERDAGRDAEKGLVTSEGVDEASADSTVEGPSSGGSPEATSGAAGRPARESDPAPPSGDVTSGTPSGGGPGQELAAGEG